MGTTSIEDEIWKQMIPKISTHVDKPKAHEQRCVIAVSNVRIVEDPI